MIKLINRGRMFAGLAGVLIAMAGMGCQEERSTTADEMVLAVLWMQTSGEAMALQYQAFDLARTRLDEALAEPSGDSRKPAIILDIDETVLDNSPQCAKQALTDGRYSVKAWREWSKLACARPIPGAKEFLDYADARGVAIFYISNRSEAEREETLTNLRRKYVAFAQADSSHVLLRQAGERSGKETRRREVEKEHRVLLLLGDSLSDFSDAFDEKTVAERNAEVKNLRAQFGRRFIALPNAMYGDWSNALLGYREKDLSDKEVGQLRRSQLRIAGEARN